MNERIIEIAQQSGAVMFGGKPCFFGEQDIERFAQLIVMECANLVEGFELTQEMADGEYWDFEAKSVLMDHFQIETL